MSILDDPEECQRPPDPPLVEPPEQVPRALGAPVRPRDVEPELVADARADSPAPALPSTTSLFDSWDEALSELPPDWSDLLCELELDSSDHLPRAALLGAPMNPTRVVDANALRFRCSGKQGYGVSPGMARRCFERMDAEGITGRITIQQVLSDTENAVTQGPIWRLAGRSV